MATLSIGLVVVACQPLMSPTPAASPTHTVTTASQEAPSTETAQPTAALARPSPMWTPSQTAAPTETVTVTAAATSTATATPSVTATQTASPSPTWTRTPLPEVVASYPIDGDRAVPLDARFVVALSSPVNPFAVEARLQFSPMIEGRLSWSSSQELAFEPDGLLTDTVYAMTFTLRSVSDIQAATTITATFETGAKGVPVPILMYHRFRELDSDATQGQRDWSVSPSEFAAQMDYLAQHGYHTINFGDLLAYVEEGQPLPRRPVIISMDDGWREVYDVAWPILRERGLLASLFVLPDYAEYTAYMSWEELQELAEAGFYFGSHSLTHPDLRTLSATEARSEICASKELIEAKLDQSIVVFCYPMGAYNQDIISQLDACGYRAACTLAGGYYQRSKDGLFRLRRVWIHYDMTLDQFAAKLPW